jgi:hypothetical protein
MATPPFRAYKAMEIEIIMALAHLSRKALPRIVSYRFITLQPNNRRDEITIPRTRIAKQCIHNRIDINIYDYLNHTTTSIIY